MNTAELQQTLFKQVKERLPAHVSLAEELASVLGVSSDSAYRRIRGGKLMDIGELLEICGRYRISLDALMALGGGNFLFQGRFVGAPDLPFADWLVSMNAQLEQLASTKDATFIFRAEDIPTFHYFQFDELTLFKLFFWRRTILNDPAFQGTSFSLSDRDEHLLALARKTSLTYGRLPSTEIWNADSLNAFLRQVTFYRDSGAFAHEADVDALFNALLALIDHLQAECSAGVKFQRGEAAATGSASFQVYVNEVMQGDNMIYATAGGTPMVFVNHSAINYISTTDAAFCEETRLSIENVMRRSVLISSTGEKERNRFFNGLRQEVERRRK